MLKRLGFGLLSVVLLAGAWFCFHWGFSQLSDIRQMDRLPLSPLSAVTQGVYAVQGTIDDDGKTITAPYSNDRVIYYQYRLEEEYTDSEGDRKTRTLESGRSATPFILYDSSRQRPVLTSPNIGSIKWSAPRTYHQKNGRRIYTEYTLRAGDRIQMLAWYDYRQKRFDLSHMSSNLNPIVTNETLKAEGGQNLLGASLLISAATGMLAVSLAAALVMVGIHRFWVFVTVMTLGLLIALWSIGTLHLKRDWQNAAELYAERAEGARAANNPGALEDLYAHYALIKASAAQWPDSLLFGLAEKTSFRPPAIDPAVATRIESRLTDTSNSHIQQRWVVFTIAGLSMIITVVLIWWALKAIRFKRLVEFIPTSQTQGLAYGITELFGMINVDDDKPFLTSKLNGQKCVAYRYEVEERRGTGKNAKWVTVDSGTEDTLFWLEDNSGRVAVNPQYARIRFPEKKVRRTGRTRYTEYWLPPFRNVYCLGFAGLADHEDADRLIIKNSDDFDFLITTQEETDVVKGEGASGFMLTGLALGSSLVAGTVLLAGTSLLTPLDLIQVSLIVPITLFIITLILHYNGLVFLRNRVDKTRADIDTLLQRRHDLWPRLMETVKGYLSHEQKLLAAIGKLRSHSSSLTRDPSSAEKQLVFEREVVNALNSRIEANPDLKANALVKTFQQQMQRSEEELALLRNGYNDSIELYNNQIQKLPDLFLAKAFGFKKVDFFRQ
ncbi:MAG: LemA family protein [Reinekea sp.]